MNGNYVEIWLAENSMTLADLQKLRESKTPRISAKASHLIDEYFFSDSRKEV